MSCNVEKSPLRNAYHLTVYMSLAFDALFFNSSAPCSCDDVGEDAEEARGCRLRRCLLKAATRGDICIRLVAMVYSILECRGD